jgi:hypothetical protein
MLQRILDVKNSLVSTIAINYPKIKNITNEEIIVIGQVCELLKVFKDCTEEISSEKQVSVSKKHTSKPVFEKVVQQVHQPAWCKQYS